MGCLCSKESVVNEIFDEKKGKKEESSDKTYTQPVKTEQISFHHVASSNNSISSKTRIVERPSNASNSHKSGTTTTIDLGNSVGKSSKEHPRITSLPHGVQGEQIAAGWPSWLTSVAGEAISGLIPRRSESYKKLSQIGQGTYSVVYKARDMESGKLVAMKKVRFTSMDPESVRFMAREIHMLRKLDHPNVMKLESIVISRISGSLYLVFEYMEHDLAGLLARPGVQFSEPQIKCYMQQLFRGLEHCHSRGVLHRDIKGSNLLVNDDGILKIGDFGLATFFQPDQSQPLTSRVVTLWYRAPELLLGATNYGVAVDLWSSGCIIAELFVGEPILPGRTEVEQLHKIFKLCGTPSDDYWEKTKLPRTTSFKLQQPYKRRLVERFKDLPCSALKLVEKLLALETDKRGSASSVLKSEFFTTKPLPCDPSSLPKYPPSKELETKLRGQEAKRKRATTVKARDPESVHRGERDVKAVPTSEFDASSDVTLQEESNSISINQRFIPCEDAMSAFPIEPPRGERLNKYSHCNTMSHPNTIESSGTGKATTRKQNKQLTAQKSLTPRAERDFSDVLLRKEEPVSSKEFSMGYITKKNRLHCSGPLLPPGGNVEDMLKEHERQIQQAVRLARLDKNRSNRENRNE